MKLCAHTTLAAILFLAAPLTPLQAQSQDPTPQLTCTGSGNIAIGAITGQGTTAVSVQICVQGYSPCQQAQGTTYSQVQFDVTGNGQSGCNPTNPNSSCNPYGPSGKCSFDWSYPDGTVGSTQLTIK